jgi:hypothetical protein
MHPGITVSELHTQPGSGELADELTSSSVHDRLLDHVAFKPVRDRLLDGGLRREHGNPVDLVDLVSVETPLAEPEPAVLGPANPLAGGKDDLDLPGVHIGETPEGERGVTSDNALASCGKDSLVVLIERSDRKGGEAIEALCSPFETAFHGQPTQIVGADAGLLGVLGPDEAVLIGSQLDQAVVGASRHAESVADSARY